MAGHPTKSYERFEHGPFRLEYLRFGKGAIPILAFHGFGRKCEDFAGFAPYLQNDLSLYSFNLFGHGKSRYPSERIEHDTIDKEEWAGFFAEFLDSIGAEQAYLMGYSMGGRLALCLIEQKPERFIGAYLFAPDGLQRFSWFRWASRIPFLQRIFKNRIEAPALLFRSFHALHRARLISSRTKDFLLHQVRTEEQRRAVYRIWNMHRDLTPKHRKLRRSMKERRTRLRLFFGRFDPIIPPSKGRSFIKRMKGNDTSMLTLQKGHILLDPKMIHASKKGGEFDEPLEMFC
jgi:pimeloyl-ACP methyl ester carboxylesterase